MAGDPGRKLIVGKIVGAYGTRGWVRIWSETDPRDNVLRYSPWFIGEETEPRAVLSGKRHGKGLIAQIEGCWDRDQAAALIGLPIRIRRSQLPPPGPDAFYWADLEGLRVLNREGMELGRVARVFATAANDVLVVTGKDRERLIPFLWEQVVQEIDFQGGWMRVDWEADF